MMPPNKNKRGSAAVTEASPDADPSISSAKNFGSSSCGDDGEETPKRGGLSQLAPSTLRTLGFSGQKKPAELFRKDLISAMKLADKDSLPEESYFLIADPWRQEWEKGVQVPVNVTDIKQASVRETREKSKSGDFKMPHKLLHERADDVYKKGQHILTGMPELAEQLVRYDLDDLDVCWLEELNFRFREMGLTQITEWNMERTIEALENHCHEKMTDVMKNEEGMGIEYDEDVICDVCRSPESEESNEMVFCDGCDICVHQACYGIQNIPQGNWLCRMCAVGVKPTCMLCPNVGGAMKCTRSGTKWVHVSCALWIPEVSFGDLDKIEPVTKISHIPPSRWSLVCCLCKERVGACVQCCVKSCKTAFHVTCAFNEGLQMKTFLDNREETEQVRFKSFCPKHSRKQEHSHSESELDTPRKKSLHSTPCKNSPCKGTPRKGSPRKDSPPTPRKELSQQEKANLRSKKLKNLEAEFYRVVDVSEVSKSLMLDEDMVNIIFFYWKLKRKCNWDKPLLTPKKEEADILEKQEEDSRLARMKMFVHLRHDLERARNLCYMISRREKMKRQLFHNKEHVFKNMVRVLKNKSLRLSKSNVRDIVQNYHFDSVYDDYGRSVQNLPGELNEDDSESTEAEGSVSDVSVSVGRKEKVVRKAENETLSQTSSSRRSRGNHQKGRRKGGRGKNAKEVENKALFSEASASTSGGKGDDVDSDDNVMILSADESEDEAVSRLPGIKALSDSGFNDFKHDETSWSRVVAQSLMSRRTRQKKPRRGRKPWYEKQNQRFELTPTLGLSTDDDDDSKGGSSETGSGHLGVESRDTSEEILLVDVGGEGEEGEGTLYSPSIESQAGSSRTPDTCQKTNSRRRVGTKSNRGRRIKSDGISCMDKTRTKSGVIPNKECDSGKGESDDEVNCGKEKTVSKSQVSSLLPTRTSSRKRRKSEKLVSGTEITHAYNRDSSTNKAQKVYAKKVAERVADVDRTCSPSPSKVKRLGRNCTGEGEIKMKKESSTEAIEAKEMKKGKRGTSAEQLDFHQQSKCLQSSGPQIIKTENQSHCLSAVNHGKGRTNSEISFDIYDFVKLSDRRQGGVRCGSGESNPPQSPMRQGQKSSHQAKSGESNPPQSPLRQGRKSSHQAKSGESNPSQSPVRPGQNNSHQAKSGESNPPQPQVRQGRKSSHQARLLWNTLLKPPGSSPNNRTKSGQPALAKSTSGTGRCNRKLVIEPSKNNPIDKSVGKVSVKQEKDVANQPVDKSVAKLHIKQERDAGKLAGNSDTRNQEDNVPGKAFKLFSKDLKKDVSRQSLPLTSKDVLNKSVRNGSQRRFSKRGRRGVLANGFLDSKQRKIDVFFSRERNQSIDSEEDKRSASRSASRHGVLHEISPDKRGNFQNSILGTRDNVENYNSEQLHIPGSESPCPNQRGEGRIEYESPESSSGGSNKELDAVSVFTKGQCEADKFSMDSMRALRSQSPSSDASTNTGLCVDSRESTPRRFTRSQMVDGAMENSLCSKERYGTIGSRTKLRGHRSKAADAST